MNSNFHIVEHYIQNWSNNISSLIDKLYHIIPENKINCLLINDIHNYSNIIDIKLCRNEHSLIYDFKNDREFEKHSKLNDLYHLLHNNHKIIKIKDIEAINDNLDFVFINCNSNEELYYYSLICFNKCNENAIIIFNVENRNNDRFLFEFRNEIGILHNDNNIIAIKVLKLDLNFHVYISTFNNALFLQRFFDHYKEAEKIYIIDQMSTDNTLQIALRNNAEIIQSENENNTMLLTNNKWREVKNSNPDFVIIGNIHEFLFFHLNPTSLKQSLKILRSKNINCIKPGRHNIYCLDSTFNSILKDQLLLSSLTNGTDEIKIFNDDLILFNPQKYKEYDEILLDNYNNTDKCVIINYRYICYNKRHNNDLDHNYNIRLKKLYDTYINNSILRLLYPNNNISELKIQYNNIERSCLTYNFKHQGDDINQDFYLYNLECKTFITIGSNSELDLYKAKLCSCENIISINNKNHINISYTILLNGWSNIHSFQDISNKTINDITQIIYNKLDNNLMDFIIKINLRTFCNNTKKFIHEMLKRNKICILILEFDDFSHCVNSFISIHELIVENKLLQYIPHLSNNKMVIFSC